MSETKCRILVVDDDPFVGEMLAMILEDEGYEIETAESGEDALEKYRAAPDIGLLITDMNMPGMSGLQLIAAIRAAIPGIPVILLTGTEDASLGDEADEYLLKDEDLQDNITVSVERVLAGKA
jgi:CheY-like chemotaxis protein